MQDFSFEHPWNAWCYSDLFSFLNFHFQVEILPSDGSEVQSVYDELYVQISADTFEKVDSAASLIELLVTSVSVSF